MSNPVNGTIYRPLYLEDSLVSPDSVYKSLGITDEVVAFVKEIRGLISDDFIINSYSSTVTLTTAPDGTPKKHGNLVFKDTYEYGFGELTSQDVIDAVNKVLHAGYLYPVHDLAAAKKYSFSMTDPRLDEDHKFSFSIIYDIPERPATLNSRVDTLEKFGAKTMAAVSEIQDTISNAKATTTEKPEATESHDVPEPETTVPETPQEPEAEYPTTEKPEPSEAHEVPKVEATVPETPQEPEIETTVPETSQEPEVEDNSAEDDASSETTEQQQ